MISKDHGLNYGDVPLGEATAFLGGIAVVVIFLLILLLFANKWRTGTNGTSFSPDLKELLQTHRQRPKKSQSGVPAAVGLEAVSAIRDGEITHCNHELISLAEKGGSAGSCGSSSCSTSSVEDGESRRALKALRHRESRSNGSATNIGAVQEHIGLTIHHHDENALFDVTDLQSDCGETTTTTKDRSDSIFSLQQSQHQQQYQQVQSQQATKCGSIEVAFAYDAPMRKMTVHILQGRGVPEKNNGGSSHTQVRLVLLPGKKQKHKTKMRSGETPQYLESFLFHRVNPEDVNSMGVRFRLYGCGERMRREKMLGEAAVTFAALNLELETNMWLMLEPRSNPALTTSSYDLLSLTHSDSLNSYQPLCYQEPEYTCLPMQQQHQQQQHGGVAELLLGLAYSCNTGRLAVEVIKGSHLGLRLRPQARLRPPDTYVKLCLVSSSGQELARCKTNVHRGQPNPLYKEIFVFQVALFQLYDVTLMISVYNRRSMKRREMIGWFSLGLNSSSEEELTHWNEMRDASGEQLCRWHILVTNS